MVAKKCGSDRCKERHFCDAFIMIMVYGWFPSHLLYWHFPDARKFKSYEVTKVVEKNEQERFKNQQPASSLQQRWLFLAQSKLEWDLLSKAKPGIKGDLNLRS